LYLDLVIAQFTIASAHTMSGSSQAESSKSKAMGLGKAITTHDIHGHDLPPSPAPSSPHNGKKYALMTELVFTESTDQYNASSVPIYQVRANVSYIMFFALEEWRRPDNR
jgi:hypothetical protein